MNKFVTQYIDSADYLVEKYFKKKVAYNKQIYTKII